MRRITPASVIVFNAVAGVIFLLYISCNSAGPAKETDTTDFSEGFEGHSRDTEKLFLDSLKLDTLLHHYEVSNAISDHIKEFYFRRNYEFVWLNGNGLNPEAGKLMNLINYEIGTGVPPKNDVLHILYKQASEMPEPGLFSNLEVLLTIRFFQYGERNWQGSKDLPDRIGWFIERKQLDLDMIVDSLLKGKDQSAFWFAPVYVQYGRIRNYILKYKALQRLWPQWSLKGELSKGDSSDVIPLIKKQLYLMDDLQQLDSSSVFDGRLEEAVIHFQKRNGVEASGIIRGETLALLQETPEVILGKLIVNMERYRWVPWKQEGTFAAVNIPDFRLYIYNYDSILWSTKVIVGRRLTKTVIFNSTIDEVIFRPSWTMPVSIIRNEAIPAARHDSNYFSRNNLVITDNSGRSVDPQSINWKSGVFPYIIRQRPGPDNALGLIKFNLSNPYDIYLHDTPSKYLFERTDRTFSHGCIRVQHAKELAALLLTNQMTEAEITDALEGNVTRVVKLTNTIPVFITYFTAWVDNKGVLNMRKDIYHHDKKLMQEMAIGQ